MSTELPKHIAIIMDGNGRWAKSRGLSRSEGHREGSLAIERLMEVALEIGLENISLYAFSTENWKRPISEIQSIFKLLNEFIETRLEKIQKNGIRILHSGTSSKIPFTSYKKVRKAVKLTEKNNRLTLNFCLNYGAKEELLSAYNRILKTRKQAKISLEKEITEQELEAHLYTYPLPPVDLLIRTAGEQRVSNFLLWQIAYAELYFTDTLWPDFDRQSLFQALEWYSKRVRKFGGLNE